MDSDAFDPQADGVAIVGMAGRFPGALSLAEFRDDLLQGKESVRFFTDEELSAAGVDASLFRASNFVRAHGFLDGVDLFDAGFFGFSAMDAEGLDPQLRLFLECAWEGLETAGCSPGMYRGVVGVFAGCTASSYVFNLYASGRALDHMQLALSTDKDHLATQVLYRLNLKGPSVAIQTACSTSLVATTFACQSLFDYQCDVALAGGSSIGIPQVRGYMYEEGGILSPDGHCRAFDAKAGGTVGGSGVGVVVLKRLSDALADRDPILAVIRGWATNNDGAQKVGYTAPSVDGQARVIALAHAVAGISADSLQYVEAHGTGTALGDPVEVAALTQAFRASTDRVGYCALGSVKTSIGHLDAAAGIAGLIKTVLALQARTIPPSLHFERPNPTIDFASSPFFVPATAMPWVTDGGPRRAGVSAFGIGGTNAHVVLEEAPAVEPSGPAPKWQLLLVSAKTHSALDRATANLAAHLGAHPEQPFADVAYTTQVGRAAFPRRRALVCDRTEDVAAVLAAADPRRLWDGTEPRETRPVAFMCPGQGAQHVDMLHGLYRVERVFRDEVNRCAQMLLPVLGLDLRHLLYPTPAQRERAAEQLMRTAVTQPALFAVEYALAKLWTAWGVTADCFIGHSIGEYVAACLADVFRLEDALWLVAQRGALMERTAPGAMLAVPLGELDVQPWLDARVALAAVNAPSSCVLSGTVEEIDRVASALDADGVACRKLRTSHAFHSPLMDPVIEPFLDALRLVHLQPPRLPFASNLTGEWISAAEATSPEYWAAHLRHTVRFSAGVMRVLEQRNPVLLEVGPGTTLTSLARMQALGGRGPASEHQPVIIASARHPDDVQEDEQALLSAAGRLWLAGICPDWPAVHASEQRRLVALPTYPFERERYWIDALPPAPPAAPVAARASLENWFSVPSWRTALASSLLTDARRSIGPRRWLLFADAIGLSRAIRRALESRGDDVISVEVGERFGRTAAGYVVRPADRIDYETMLEQLQAGAGLPDCLLHAWMLTATPADGDDLARMKELGFHSLLCLAQTLGAREPEKVRDLAVIGNFVVSLPEERGPVCPAKALTTGAVRVIPQEYANLRCRLIDVDLPHAAVERIADLVVDDVLHEPFHPMVAYRDGRRFVESLDAVRLPEPVQPAPVRLKHHGVYLLTGGFGGIGLVLAQYLAETVSANLALLGRSGLPPKARWAEIIAARDDHDPITRRVRAMLQLESTGAGILPLSIDITDPAQARAAVRQVVDHFGTIDGVIHAAGVAGGGIIELKTREVADRVLAPKVEGTLALYAAVSGMQLDFFVICSSLSSLVGGAGQVDYCAANNFEDAFARAHSKGSFVQAINWDAWQQVGMAVDTELPPDLHEWRSQTLAQAIRPEEGRRVFDLVLRTRLAQVAVCTTNLPSMIGGADLAVPDTGSVSPVAEFQAAEVHVRPDLLTTFAEPLTEKERAVADLWQALLGVSPIGREDSFFELGGHSLLAVQLVSRLKASYDITMTVRDIFEHSTVRRLAEWLDASDRRRRQETDDFSLLLAEVERLPE